MPMDKIFSEAINCLDINNKITIAVACSGGADSLALTFLAQNWAKKADIKLIALTVDHGLREASGAEARQVGRWLKKRGIAHAILTWQGKKPARNIQEEARQARYRLIADYCVRHGIAHVLVAHTLEDQAETFLLRLARGSGVDGLAAMSPQTELYGVTVLRPLLNVPKAELRTYLKKQKQPWLKDPSNENPAYDRVKMRRLLPALAEVGITPQRLAMTTQNMSRARAFLETATADCMAEACTLFPEGYTLVRYLPDTDELALRMLATLCMQISGQLVRPRLRDLERLYTALKKPKFAGATLYGCIFARHGEQLLICREPTAVQSPVPVKQGETIMWDNRFMVTWNAALRATRYVGALTQEGWLAIAKSHTLRNPYPDKRILYTLPAVRDARDRILAVPHLGVTAREDIDCRVTFSSALHPR